MLKELFVSKSEADWGCCPKKQAWRHDQIIQSWRDIFGSTSIPKDMQVWSLPGKSDGVGGAIPGLSMGTELDQLLEAGLIKPHQYHGVEIRSEVYEANLKIKGPNWYHNDLLSAIKRSIGDDKFKPAIVSFDSMQYPSSHAAYVADLVYQITQVHTDVLVVINQVKRCRRQEIPTSELVDPIAVEERFKMAHEEAIAAGKPWVFPDKESKCYIYNGHGDKSRSKLASIKFWRRST
jgi:subtilisin family serine protease